MFICLKLDIMKSILLAISLCIGLGASVNEPTNADKKMSFYDFSVKDINGDTIPNGIVNYSGELPGIYNHCQLFSCLISLTFLFIIFSLLNSICKKSEFR